MPYSKHDLINPQPRCLRLAKPKVQIEIDHAIYAELAKSAKKKKISVDELAERIFKVVM